MAPQSVRHSRQLRTRQRAAILALRYWPYVRGRWKLASLLVCGDLRGGPSLERNLTPRLGNEVVCGRLGVAVRIRADSRYLSPYVFGDHEPLTSRLFAELLRPGEVAVDVGANFGWFSALFARSVGNEGAVVAFEPLGSFASELRDTIALNGIHRLVHVEECGLGEREGECVIYTFPRLPGGHASSIDLGASDAVPHRCRISTLDNVMSRLGIARIDLLKVDVEGAERDVFQGARATLSGSPGPIVHFEVNEACLSARCMTAAQVFEPLATAGYTRLWRIDPRPRIGRKAITPVSAPTEGQNADYIAAKPGSAERVDKALKRMGLRYSLRPK